MEKVTIQLLKAFSSWLIRLSKKNFLTLLTIVLFFPIILEVTSLLIVGLPRFSIISIWLRFDGVIILVVLLSNIRNNRNHKYLIYLYLIIIYTALLRSAQIQDLRQIGMGGPQHYYATIGMSVMVLPVLALIAFLTKKYWLRIGVKTLWFFKTFFWLHMLILILNRLFPAPIVGEAIWCPPPPNFLGRVIDLLFNINFFESSLARYLAAIFLYGAMCIRCRENESTNKVERSISGALIP